MAKLDEARERLGLIKEGKWVEMARKEGRALGSDGGVSNLMGRRFSNMWPMQRA